MLRERTTGTLERLMTMPMAKLDLLAGYAIAFGALAALQAGLVSAVGFVFCDLDAGHSVALVIALAIDIRQRETRWLRVPRVDATACQGDDHTLLGDRRTK
jgi:hypothetical protein